MALRELLLELGIKVDQNDVKKADNALDSIGKAAKRLKQIFVAGAIAKTIGTLLDLGSAANETSNVIEAAFGDAGNAVDEWAKRQSKAMGRSRFELREMAAATGAIVQPMLGSKEAAADMATQIGQLAVDLGSFFNANDEDALRALQSGLVGSTEPLLKFGVVMKQANLQTFAQQEGIKGLVKDMDEASLTSLRFAFIMSKTKNAQGDAEKTADGYANATKALKAQIKDQATILGQKLVPIAEKLLKVLIPLVKVVGTGLGVAFDVIGRAIEAVVFIIEAVIGTFQNLESAMDIVTIGLGVMSLAMLKFGKVAVITAAKSFKAWIKAMLPFVLMAVLIAVIILLIDDLIVFFQGGDSLIGRFIDGFRRWVREMGGVTAAIGALLARLFQKIFNLSDETTQKLSDAFWAVADAVKDVFVFIGTKIGEGLAAAFLWVVKFAEDFERVMTAAVDAVIERYDALVDAVADFIQAAAEATGLDSLVDKGATRNRKEEAVSNRKRSQGIKEAARKRLKILQKLEREGLGTVTSTAETATNVARTELTGVKDQAAAQARFKELSQNINAPVTVTVDASNQTSPAAIATQTAGAIAAEQRKNRAARQALVTE